jgi:UDP:flavonoid glycosyltransferase YjiC (YdhE family)/nitroreductase
VGTRRILFVAEAVTLAHVGRMHALASTLDRSKYTPLLAWHPRYNRLLGEVEDEFYPLESINTGQFLERLRAAKPVYDFRTMEVYAAWELEVFREAEPDAVVGDFRLSLATSTQIAGIPYLNVVNAHWSPYARPRFTVPESPPVRVFGPQLAQLVFSIARPIFFRSYANDFNRLAEKFGRKSFGHDLRSIYCEGDRTLYPDIPEITPTFGLPPTHRYLGPVTWSPTVPEPAFLSELPGDRPVIYVNLGTSGNPDLVPRILEVLSRRPVRVIVGGGGRAEATAAAPNVLWADFVPGEAACRRADLMICNGGVASAQQALIAGIPVLGIPSNLDQYLYMHYAERAGVATIVRSDDAGEKRLSDAVDRLLEGDGHRQRARQLAERARSYRAGEVLDEVLGELFDDTPPAPRRSPPPPGRDAQAVRPPIEVVTRAVEAAVLAPSAGNCQPWRYRWTGDTLDISIVPERSNPFLNFVNVDTWVSLGAVLTNLRVAAASDGYRLHRDLFPGDSRYGLVGRAWFSSGGDTDDGLAELIGARCTNRRNYHDRQIPDEVRDRLCAVVRPEVPEVHLDWIDQPEERNRIAEATSVFYQLVFENPGLHASLLERIRWSERDERESRTGLSLPSLELGRVPRVLFRLAASRQRARFLAPTGLFRLYRKATVGHLRRSAAIGIFSVGGHDPRLYVRAGEAFETMWLEATRSGLAVHPLAGMLLLAYRCRFADGAGLTGRQRRLTEDAIAAIGEVIPAFVESMPVIMFRIGYADPASARSSRLPLEAVFDVAQS